MPELSKVPFHFVNEINVCLQPLKAGIQSGGEKSVTTAIYMMALQELSKVPFRFVDEINQGMDSVNESKIWDLLAKTAEGFSAQYFYIAPKFPNNLKLTQNTAVVFCFNGNITQT